LATRIKNVKLTVILNDGESDQFNCKNSDWKLGLVTIGKEAIEAARNGSPSRVNINAVLKHKKAFHILSNELATLGFSPQFDHINMNEIITISIDLNMNHQFKEMALCIGENLENKNIESRAT
tara:strand:+ start:370 stop:738 length:369 start_codon:yes stop_codon:yes gene_type:complete